ncbi:unnamed protein product [Calicophoron daubneyi]|uniref:EF-hand domain-containing protein n=1 Tax=Calicophoron daubneyi TaxID=300641 RepID=A0AAV2TZV9_CALDB
MVCLVTGNPFISNSKLRKELGEDEYEDLREHEAKKHYKEYKRLAEARTKAERRRLQEELDDQYERLRHHPAVHEPGSRAQFQEVWHDEDHFEPDQYDPKVFFGIHDLDGDGRLSEEELTALLEPELEKVYDQKNVTNDQILRKMDLIRMRDHVFNEVDKNHDRFISLKEFLDHEHNASESADHGYIPLQDMETPPHYGQKTHDRYLLEEAEDMWKKHPNDELYENIIRQLSGLETDPKYLHHEVHGLKSHSADVDRNSPEMERHHNIPPLQPSQSHRGSSSITPQFSESKDNVQTHALNSNHENPRPPLPPQSLPVPQQPSHQNNPDGGIASPSVFPSQAPTPFPAYHSGQQNIPLSYGVHQASGKTNPNRRQPAEQVLQIRPPLFSRQLSHQDIPISNGSHPRILSENDANENLPLVQPMHVQSPSTLRPPIDQEVPQTQAPFLGSLTQGMADQLLHQTQLPSRQIPQSKPLYPSPPHPQHPGSQSMHPKPQNPQPLGSQLPYPHPPNAQLSYPQLPKPQLPGSQHSYPQPQNPPALDSQPSYLRSPKPQLADRETKPHQNPSNLANSGFSAHDHLYL